MLAKSKAAKVGDDILQPGPYDSGSIVLDMDNNIIGLLFAGSEQTTIINPIDKVLELLNVSR